jgi:prevent-host-death family protein
MMNSWENCVYVSTLDIYTSKLYAFLQRRLEGRSMEKVNALKLRNNLGEILEKLRRTGKPVLISKGKEVRAVLITPEDFERRFLDAKAKEDKEQLLKLFKSLRKKKKGEAGSLELLRQLRGYQQ